eukprot:CAMPEP_0181445448 /NCGR_PEP_ID=MMETSP1110-20121109/25592_1 /TAXON_ID=174948 /ORGANISM="Symbiodinium sp., Strain CCMP421" /LENGTH=111 /DNA_ID=CAMNT_0023569491 /DNA_START=165 /DNA_END=500 /DNA_ORIENTATION=+
MVELVLNLQKDFDPVDVIELQLVPLGLASDRRVQGLQGLLPVCRGAVCVSKEVVLPGHLVTLHCCNDSLQLGGACAEPPARQAAWKPTKGRARASEGKLPEGGLKDSGSHG